MTSHRRLISAFIVCHMCALVLGAIPPPGRVPAIDRRDRVNAGASGRIVTAFDTAGALFAGVTNRLWAATTAVRPAVNGYLRITSLGQSWAMFSNPPLADQYVRVRYYIRPERGSTWVATELVRPAHREDRVRLVRSFRDSYQDKALEIAITNFRAGRNSRLIQANTPWTSLPDDLAPVGRYFARRFERTYLTSGGQRIVRTEVWVGAAPNRQSGRVLDPGRLAERAAALQAYYDGPLEERVYVPTHPPYHAVDREADIAWVLEYFEES